MSDSSSSSHLARLIRIWWFLPLALGLMVRLPVLANELVYDDHTLVTLHPRLADASFAVEIFRRDYGLEFGMRQPSGYYRPGFMLLNWLLFRVAGAAPLVYHLASLLVFAIVVVIVTACFRALIPGTPRLASWAALLFAVHPLNTESVVLFASLPDLVVQGMAALAILLMIAETKSAGRSALWFAGGFLAASCGALFKETGFVILGVLACGGLAFSVTVRGTMHPAPWKTPLAMLAGLAFCLPLRLQANLLPIPLSSFLSPFLADGATEAWVGFATGIHRLAFPHEFIVLIDRHLPSSSTAALGAITAAIGAFMAIAWFVGKKRLPETLLALWLAGSTFALVLPLSRGLPYADRYFAAAPWIALLAILGGLMRNTLRADSLGRARSMLIALAGLYVALAGARSLTGNFKCLNAVVFWRTFLADQPQSIYPRVGMAGVAFNELGDFALAEQLALEVIQEAPTSGLAGQMELLIAEVRIVEHNFAEGLKWLEAAESHIGSEPRRISLKAIALEGLNEPEKALDELAAAISRQPAVSEFHFQWARIALRVDAVPLEEIVRHAEACRRLGGTCPDDYLSVESVRELRRKADSSK